MARQDIITALITAAGTRQADRRDPHLDPSRAPLDGRDTIELLLAARALAARLNYYATSPVEPAGNWSEFLPAPATNETEAAFRARLAALVSSASGDTPAHLALLIAFLRVARHPRQLLDDFTRRHLDFQMQTVLGFAAQPARPDHTHLLIQLKKGAAPLEIGTGLRLSGGKDATGKELIYAPVRPVVVNQARIESLRCLRVEAGHVVFAPVADSANGLGDKLPADDPNWHPFGLRHAGRAALPDAPIGLALACDVLRMAQGRRRITVTLDLLGLATQASAALLAQAFEVRLSGLKHWLGPYPISRGDSMLSNGTWTFSVTVPADQPAIVDADPVVLQQPFPAGRPVLQLLLKENSGNAFGLLAGTQVRQAGMAVQVDGVRGLVLESELGVLDPKKPFLPFGPQPGKGSTFHVACAETLDKRLSSLSLQLLWQDAPTSQQDLTDRYAHYSGQAGLASGVRALAAWADAGGAHPAGTVTLLPAPGGRITLDLTSGTGAGKPKKDSTHAALRRTGDAVARKEAEFLRKRRGISSDAPDSRTSPGAGSVTLTLDTDLLHAAWRSEAVAGLLKDEPVVLKEPWTPKLKEVTLNYAASAGPSRLDLSTQASFTEAEVEFFHVDAFGVSREHPWLAGPRASTPPAPVTLLPRHADAGELLIGLAGIGAGEPLNLLFQVADGSTDPLAQAQALSWSVLCHNTWQALAVGTGLLLDTTHHLRGSGIVSLILPEQTTTDNTRLPAGLVWLRAAIPAQPGAACRLIGIHPNAVEVVFQDQGNAASHLASALPAGSISRFRTPPATVKQVTQPYASSGGALQEDAQALARRAAERLRHRNRAITSWDHEHLVLQAFPAVDRVKCIPHARPGSWLAPGHTMLVVVPDLRNRNAVDPLQPRIDLDTLEQIKDFVLARAPMGLDKDTLTVCNPAYRPVRVAFKVAMRRDFAFSYYRSEINQALVRHLSPWAFDTGQTLEFGGRVLRSALVDFVEELPWVDYVTDFHLSLVDAPERDAAELVPDTPDAILVSAPDHLIDEVT